MRPDVGAIRERAKRLDVRTNTLLYALDADVSEAALLAARRDLNFAWIAQHKDVPTLCDALEAERTKNERLAGRLRACSCEGAANGW